LLKSVMFLALGTGGTSAIFHTFGTLYIILYYIY
jgi:hypothetical protein